jgi:uncharacterized protein (DUF2336 family)
VGVTLDYDRSKSLAASAEMETRLALARRADVRPEILYFLAEDQAAEVRQAIAGNTATPRQADLLLAADQDLQVRQVLAQKIVSLVPHLSAEGKDTARDLTLQVLSKLAEDQASRVRQVIAEAIKDTAAVPAELVLKLARDVEIRVAAPVLERSPLLSDTDLLEIIGAGPIRGALESIARRRDLGADVSEAVVAASVDRPAEAAVITALLNNDSAQIREATLDRILDQAPQRALWHRPLVTRPKMPMQALARLADFVSASLLDLLQERPDIDTETAQSIARKVQERLQSGGADEEDEAVPADVEALAAAIAAGRHKAVAVALARDAGVPLAIVDKILASGSAKAVTALAWRARLSMRMALQLQLKIGAISPPQILNPRNGSDYPLSSTEMEWQLELFDIAPRG